MPEEVRQISDSIRSMTLRGAGKIARSAAEGLLITARKSESTDRDHFFEEVNATAELLLHTRPTAVSLPNALRYVMMRVYSSYYRGDSLSELRSETISAASEFIDNSLKAREKIAEFGSRRIEDGDTIMTHCHSSAAIEVLLKAWEQGKRFSAISTETRPRYQGRMVVSTLSKKGIPVKMIVDSAARFFMEDVDKVLVGADAVAANGAVVNKIGTSMIALAAREARVNFFVATETYKFSPETLLGRLITIEFRDPREIAGEEFLKENAGVEILNPAFDVTPAAYIDIIFTEKGAIPPQAAIMILREEYGWFTRASLPDFLRETHVGPIREEDSE